eukprot:TRINITY_DN9692_c0_g1_i1.p1 TRINITY_DN9692_c0_g1~~TRINITY_DN9692_c0_g1_i1.p1  ORF type:complete len:388 (-),score=148.73 TRINITY_DN9692_c0_g1_i1:46-1209(-)
MTESRRSRKGKANASSSFSAYFLVFSLILALIAIAYAAPFIHQNSKLSYKGILFKFAVDSTTKAIETVGELPGMPLMPGNNTLKSKVFAFFVASNKMADDVSLQHARDLVDTTSDLVMTDHCFLQEDITIKVDNETTIPAAWITPDRVDNESDNVILYLHGGGYMTGGILSHHGFVAEIATRTRTKILLIDYRRCPEHFLPAAVHDSIAAYNYLRSSGYTKVILVGDSAGGGLALLTIFALRDEHPDAKQPDAAVLLSPWTDLSGSGESNIRNANNDVMISMNPERALWQHIVGSKSIQVARDPKFSPLFQENLADLPPLFIQVGGYEILEDDSVRFVEKARKAGANITFERWDCMQHVFSIFFDFFDEATQALDSTSAFVKHQFSL